MKECKQQFEPETLRFTKSKPKREVVPNTHQYHSCPKCDKVTFIHHDYEYYSSFRFSDKSCNHSFFVSKDKNIDLPSY